MKDELWSSTDTQRRGFTRRQLIAARILPDERRAPRLMTIAPAAITVCASAQRHTGLVRDMSATGMFVYSNFKPEPGEALELLVRLAKDASSFVVLDCKGAVVRVEDAGAGAAFGIAVEVADYKLVIDGERVAGRHGFARIAEQLRDNPGAAHMPRR